MPSGVSRQQMACIHYASTLSCMPSTKGIPLRLLSIHRSLACHCPVTRDTQRQTPCISYLSHAFHYSLRDLSASDKQRHTYASTLSRMPSGVSRQLKAYPMRPFCIDLFSHAVRCLATAQNKLSVSVGMYVLKRTMQWLRDKIALDAGTLPLNLQ